MMEDLRAHNKVYKLRAADRVSRRDKQARLSQTIAEMRSTMKTTATIKAATKMMIKTAAMKAAAITKAAAMKTTATKKRRCAFCERIASVAKKQPSLLSARDHEDFSFNKHHVKIGENEFRYSTTFRASLQLQCRYSGCHATATYFALLGVFQTRHYDKCEHTAKTRKVGHLSLHNCLLHASI